MLENILKLGKMDDEEGVVEAKVAREVKPKLKLGLMVMERYADVEKVLNRFRKGDAIIIVKVTPLKNKDMAELKKAVNRLKTHCDVTGADITGLGENWIVLVPPVVEIAR